MFKNKNIALKINCLKVKQILKNNITEKIKCLSTENSMQWIDLKHTILDNLFLQNTSLQFTIFQSCISSFSSFLPTKL